MSQAENANPIQVVRMQLNKMEGEFSHALPAHIPVARFMRVVMTAVQNNPDLLRTDRRSLFNAAMRAAQDGLLPDGRDGAIVPYKGDAQWMPMIGGIRKKVRNSGEIVSWDVQAVYENDDFDFQLGDDPMIYHKPKLGDRGKIIAVYSIATLKGGEKSRDVMGIDEVEKIRAISRSKNGPWANPTFYPEMAKKTVARRHSKVLPMSTDLDDLLRRDDHLYDLDGNNQGEDSPAQPQRRKIADKLTDIAQSATKADDEIEDAETIPDDAPPEGGGADDSTGESSTDTPEKDEAEAKAQQRGYRAGVQGRDRKCPPDIAKDDRLSGVWFKAFDQGKSEAAADDEGTTEEAE